MAPCRATENAWRVRQRSRDKTSAVEVTARLSDSLKSSSQLTAGDSFGMSS
jgi:hypothetical protein